MAKNFPNLGKEIDIQMQETQRVPNKMKLKQAQTRHIVIKVSKAKNKGRILRAARDKQLVIYKRTLKRLSAILSQKLCRPKRSSTKTNKQKITQDARKNKLLTKIFYLHIKVIIQNEGQSIFQTVFLNKYF